ncbi:MAG: type II toxin-antitoxin system RelB/DinJ family antitoxin [Oscillospiraceae bacterium]
MAKTETLHIRVNETVKENAEETLGMLGISISEAVNMFLCQVNLTGGLPFEVKLPAPERIIVRNKEELYKKLDEAEDDVRSGRTSSADETFGRLRDKYGI